MRLVWVILMSFWTAPLLLLYITPLLRIVFALLFFILRILKFPFGSFSQNSFFHKIVLAINDGLGGWEYYIRGPRNFIAIPSFMGILAIGLILDGFHWHFTPTFFLGLTFVTFHQQMVTSLQMSEFLRTHPTVSPLTFFPLFRRQMGPIPPQLPTEEIVTVTPDEANFKQNTRSRQTFFPILTAVWDTAHIAHLGLRSLKYIGEKYVREIVDLMGSLWGKRILELMRGKLTVTGQDHLENLDGKIILILNHKSQLDFALLFFALSGITLNSGRKIRPRFILAKDHFKDNPVVYDLLGVGKMVEAVDMIFLDRRRKKKGLENLKQAAFFLAKKEMEVVIFPQGTRAEGNVDRSEKRRDAGYYTTLRPKDIEDDRGHLRKGTAHLALDTLLEMKPEEELHLVFVGVSGTATALPKYSMKLQTECEVQFNIAAPLTLLASDAERITKPSGPEPKTESEKRYVEWVNEIHAAIDKKLAECLGIHANLHYRFVLDLKGYFRFTPDRVQLVEQNMERIGSQDPIVFQILDRIYACPPKEWNPYLSELAQLLLDQSALPRFRELRNQVSLKMLKI